MKQTSRTANERYTPFKEGDKKTIVDIMSNSKKELTGEDISRKDKTNKFFRRAKAMSYTAVMRRMSELEKLGIVKTTSINHKQNKMNYKLI